LVLEPDELAAVVTSLTSNTAIPSGADLNAFWFASKLPLILTRVGLEIRRSDGRTPLLNDQAIEDMAIAAHLRYLGMVADADNPTQSDLAMLEWERLGAMGQESNRAQVRDIPAKLAAVGLTIRARNGASKPPASLEEHLDELAAHEHRRWNHWHYLAGYRPSDLDVSEPSGRAPTDHAAKLHSCLVPYDELTEEIKEYDREFVRAIPSLLAAVGIEAVPSEEYTGVPSREEGS